MNLLLAGKKVIRIGSYSLYLLMLSALLSESSVEAKARNSHYSTHRSLLQLTESPNFTDENIRLTRLSDTIASADRPIKKLTTESKNSNLPLLSIVIFSGGVAVWQTKKQVYKVISTQVSRSISSYLSKLQNREQINNLEQQIDSLKNDLLASVQQQKVNTNNLNNVNNFRKEYEWQVYKLHEDVRELKIIIDTIKSEHSSKTNESNSDLVTFLQQQEVNTNNINSFEQKYDGELDKLVRDIGDLKTFVNVVKQEYSSKINESNSDLVTFLQQQEVNTNNINSFEQKYDYELDKLVWDIQELKTFVDVVKQEVNTNNLNSFEQKYDGELDKLVRDIGELKTVVDVVKQEYSSKTNESNSEAEQNKNKLVQLSDRQNRLIEQIEEVRDDCNCLLDKATSEDREFKNDLRQANIKIKQLEQKIDRYVATSTILQESLVSSNLNTVSRVLQKAENDFYILRIYNSAINSAEIASYENYDRLYSAFKAIAEIGEMYFNALENSTSLGNNLEKEFKRRNFSDSYRASESEATRNQYGDRRIFRHGSERRQIFRHLTLRRNGHYLQIYFDFNQEHRKVDIGYCGQHLPISSRSN